jgi:hypothetical protein
MMNQCQPWRDEDYAFLAESAFSMVSILFSIVSLGGNEDIRADEISCCSELLRSFGNLVFVNEFKQNNINSFQ